jgi:cytochrome c
VQRPNDRLGSYGAPAASLDNNMMRFRSMRPQMAAVVLATAFGTALAVTGRAAAAPAQIGNPEQGAHDFAVCSACHQVGPAAKNGVGPVLNGIVGRKAGSYPGFAYSPANKNSGLTWTVAELQKYLANPQKLVPGTKMPFPGLPDVAKVNNIIAYLSQYDEKGEKTP